MNGQDARTAQLTLDDFPPPLPGFENYCLKCGREIRKVEVGLHKKMINRGAKEYMCLSCLSEFTGVTEEALLKKAVDFKAMGCMLFV